MSKLKIKKKKRIMNPLENFSGNWPVLMATPVPMIDHKISASLSNFIAGNVARKVALPLTLDSRSPENARNRIIHDFLSKPEMKMHTHIFFVDADTMPDNPYAIEKMLQMDKAVVSGITPIGLNSGKEFEMYWNVRKFDPQRNLYLNEMPSVPFKAEYVGGSCLLVRRDVLEKLEKPYQKCTFCSDQIEFVKGEDYYFCEKIRDAGFDIWIDPEVQCHHFHMLDLLEMILMLSRYAESIGDVTGEKEKLETRIKELENELQKALELTGSV